MTLMCRGCWIVVADGEGALILENVGTVPTPDLRLMDRIEAPQPVPLADRPGRRMDGAPFQRSAMEVTDRARMAQVALAAMIVARLAREASRGRFQRLALVAPPALLGAIRERMDEDLLRRTVLTLPKTLTGHPLGRIATLVADAMNEAA